MENIAVYLLSVDEFDLAAVENASFEQLEEWYEEWNNDDVVQKFSSLKSFQWAFNAERVDDANNWIVFVEKK